MADRYYCEEPIQGTSATLSGNEAHHLLHVMRAQPGLELVLFDGQGGEYEAKVDRCQRSTVEVAVGEHRDIERELPFTLTLAVGTTTTDRQRWLVEKAVELGVTRLVPLQTTNGVDNKKTSKIDRYIIEASKQCGRNRLMQLAPPCEWDTLVKQNPSERRLFAHPGGIPLNQIDHRPTTDLTLAIGPIGGFTDQEAVAAKDAGWTVVDLGSRLLRVETAAIALVAAATIS